MADTKRRQHWNRARARVLAYDTYAPDGVPPLQEWHIVDWADHKLDYGRVPTHRKRRGKLVEIPEEWQGKGAVRRWKKKRRDRQSKHRRKERMRIDPVWPRTVPHPRNQAPRHSSTAREVEELEMKEDSDG